ncbi:MAG: hypothetical protein R6V49_00800 [Bacteroidales bacterium]
MKDLSFYDPKILIALGEAIDRNFKIHQWLLQNGYPELAALASSLQADVDAFKWLMSNGYNHFAAFSNAIDEDNQAYQWLVQYKFRILVLLVDAAYLRPEALKILKDEGLVIFIRLAFKIRKLKEDQHRDYDFYYKMHF